MGGTIDKLLNQASAIAVPAQDASYKPPLPVPPTDWWKQNQPNPFTPAPPAIPQPGLTAALRRPTRPGF